MQQQHQHVESEEKGQRQTTKYTNEHNEAVINYEEVGVQNEFTTATNTTFKGNKNKTWETISTKLSNGDKIYIN